MFSFQIFCVKNFSGNCPFHTLDSNSKISLIIVKGNLSYVLKKCMIMLICMILL